MADAFNWVQGVFTVISSLASSLVGGGAVAWLNEHAGRRRTKLEADRRLYDVKIEAYAQWIDAMNAYVASIKPSEDGTVTRVYGQDRIADLGPLSTKLKLLECDPKARRLVEEVWNSLPSDAARRAWHYDELLAHTFNWDLYYSKIEALSELVRTSRPV